MPSAFEYTVSSLFRGQRPSAWGTWAKLESARERLELCLEAQLEREQNPDFLGLSLIVSTRSSRHANDGLLLLELTIAPDGCWPADLKQQTYNRLETLRTTGNLREQLLIASEFPLASAA